MGPDGPMNARLLARSFAAGALLCAAACQSGRSLYQWSGYERSVAHVCLSAGLVDVDREIAEITELIDRAAERSRRVPPGAHAHLGYLYYLKGNIAGAVAGLEAEKEAYPESAVFVDGLLSRIKQREG